MQYFSIHDSKQLAAQGTETRIRRAICGALADGEMVPPEGPGQLKTQTRNIAANPVSIRRDQLRRRYPATIDKGGPRLKETAASRGPVSCCVLEEKVWACGRSVRGWAPAPAVSPHSPSIRDAVTDAEYRTPGCRVAIVSSAPQELRFPHEVLTVQKILY